MGTRADFYVGRGENSEWIGSIAWDGYPDGIVDGATVGDAKDSLIFNATTEADYRREVESFFAKRQDVTRPADGWPWPWEDSCTTDYAYAFDDAKVFASCFGSQWFDPMQEQPDEPDDAKKVTFPRFSKERMAPAGSKKSGVFLIEG